MVKILLSRKLGELRWTQSDLARATGIRPNTISDLYNGMSDRISFSHLDLICEALDCDITDIIIRVPNEQRTVKSRTGSKIHKKK